MLRFLVLRLLRAVLTVTICVSAVFLALRLAGDPTDIVLSIETPPDVRAHYRELRGLDRPPAEQYLRYLASVARGDFGLSFADDRPAFAAVADALPKTFALGACALLLALLIGLPLGDPRPRGHAVMLNVIGRRPPARGFLAMAGVHWHDYGKSERPRRKLGHVTVVAGSRQARDRAARRLRRLLKFE